MHNDTYVRNLDILQAVCFGGVVLMQKVALVTCKWIR